MPNFSILAAIARDTANNQPSTSSSVFMYVILGVLVLGFIGFFIWSNYNNKKQQKKHTERLRTLNAGTKIITRGGISGVIESVNLQEGTFILKTGSEANTTYLTFVLEAIYLAGDEADKAAQQVAARVNQPSEPAKTATDILAQERKGTDVGSIFPEEDKKTDKQDIPPVE